MSFSVYIIHSTSLNKYYTGYTSAAIEIRLLKHNSNHSGFTGKANDWEVVYQLFFESKKEALQYEQKIKKRGAKRYLDDQSG